MSSKESKSREEVLAAREAKKLAKQKPKNKGPASESKPQLIDTTNEVKKDLIKDSRTEVKKNNVPDKSDIKCKDEVDRACLNHASIPGDENKSRERIQAQRLLKKADKLSKKKCVEGDGLVKEEKVAKDMTVKEVFDTLKDIANVVREVQDVAHKVQGDFGTKKQDEPTKSKAELKAERRAKQEAQRAAKQAVSEQKVAKPAPEQLGKAVEKKDTLSNDIKEKSPKLKTLDRSKKVQPTVGNHWFHQIHKVQNKDVLKKVTVNSSLHPAVTKLGVQLATGTVTGSNARCVALLDALKKMVRDYVLPAKTEFARGFEAHLATSLNYLWSMRPPSATQTNAIKYFRHHLTQLPNNVNDFDAKKTLEEEIDRYIYEQIEMAGKAISEAVRKKISTGDTILTYGCSSLIERILREAWAAGVKFRVLAAAAGDSLRRLQAAGVPATALHPAAVHHAMAQVNKVLMGASALLADGAALNAAGAAGVALAARARNVPVLVAAETHKCAAHVHADAFVHTELGNPDDLIKSVENFPLKERRSNPNLNVLNLKYDITPPSLITAVVTEVAILPCTSAPVLLRFKLSEYGV